MREKIFAPLWLVLNREKAIGSPTHPLSLSFSLLVYHFLFLRHPFSFLPILLSSLTYITCSHGFHRTTPPFSCPLPPIFFIWVSKWVSLIYLFLFVFYYYYYYYYYCFLISIEHFFLFGLLMSLGLIAFIWFVFIRAYLCIFVISFLLLILRLSCMIWTYQIGGIILLDLGYLILISSLGLLDLGLYIVTWAYISTSGLLLCMSPL